jgi:integrase
MTTDDRSPTATYEGYVRTVGWPRNDPRRRNTTIIRLERDLRPFLERFGARPIEDGITDAVATDFVATHGPECAAAALTLFADLAIAGLVSANPFPRTSSTRTHRRAIGIISDEDFADLKRLAGEVLDGPDAQMMETLLQCLGEEGLRISEALTLGWTDLDVDGGMLTVSWHDSGDGKVDTPKHGPRTIRLFAETKALLLALPPDESMFVFIDSAGRPLGRARFYSHWLLIAAAWQRSRGADHWIHERLRRDPPAHLHAHELRHRAAAWLITPKPAGAGYTAMDAAHHLGVQPELYSQVFGSLVLRRRDRDAR